MKSNVMVLWDGIFDGRLSGRTINGVKIYSSKGSYSDRSGISYNFSITFPDNKCYDICLGGLSFLPLAQGGRTLIEVTDIMSFKGAVAVSYARESAVPAYLSKVINAPGELFGAVDMITKRIANHDYNRDRNR